MLKLMSGIDLYNCQTLIAAVLFWEFKIAIDNEWLTKNLWSTLTMKHPFLMISLIITAVLQINSVALSQNQYNMINFIQTYGVPFINLWSVRHSNLLLPGCRWYIVIITINNIIVRPHYNTWYSIWIIIIQHFLHYILINRGRVLSPSKLK